MVEIAFLGTFFTAVISFLRLENKTAQSSQELVMGSFDIVRKLSFPSLLLSALDPDGFQHFADFFCLPLHTEPLISK